MNKTLEQRIEELEKKVAELEGQVPAQTKKQSLKEILDNQIVILQLAQKNCIERNDYQNIEPIAKSIFDAITLMKNTHL